MKLENVVKRAGRLARPYRSPTAGSSSSKTSTLATSAT